MSQPITDSSKVNINIIPFPHPDLLSFPRMRRQAVNQIQITTIACGRCITPISLFCAVPLMNLPSILERSRSMSEVSECWCS